MTNTISVDTSEVLVTVSDSNVSLNVCESIAEVVIGTTGPQGPEGPQGPSGNAILTGEGAPSAIIGLIGDLYIDTEGGFLYGPKTILGWGLGVVLGTGLALADVAYTHLQTTASQTWTITHPLQFVPNIVVVSLVSGTQQEVIGDYEYNGNTITATFSQPISGAAYLS